MPDSSEEREETTLISNPLQLSPKTNTSSVSQTGLIKMLFITSLYKTTFLLWVVFFGINLAYYGIVLLTSELTIGQCDHSIRSNSQVSSYRDILVASFAELPGIVLSALIVGRIGRKLSMLIMFMMGFIFILPLAFLQNEVLTFISLFGARMFIAGTLAVAIAYTPEIYPTCVMATGVGLVNAISGMGGGVICPLVAVGLLNECHRATAIVVFELVIVVSGLCVILFHFETKGQQLSDSLL